MFVFLEVYSTTVHFVLSELTLHSPKLQFKEHVGLGGMIG